MENGNIIDLIKKCLALSSSPNEHEASLALKKANELLTKYNIDLATISENNSKEKIMVNQKLTIHTRAFWVPRLLNRLCNLNYCHFIKIDKDYHILGRSVNVNAVLTINNWLYPQILRLALNSGYKGKQKNDYILGIIATISKRLNEQRLSNETMQTSNSTSIIIAVQQESDDFYRSEYPRTRTVKDRRSLNSSYYQGKKDGSQVSLNGNNRISSNTLMLNG